MQHHQRAHGTTSTIHRQLSRIQRKALKAAFILGLAASPMSTEALLSVNILDTKGKKGIDKVLTMLYPSKSMSNTLTQIKCKHCEKTFPNHEALQSHMKKVESGKRGGYRKHRAPRARFALPEVHNVKVKPLNGGSLSTLDRLAEIKARKAQLLEAIQQTLEDERTLMDQVQREYVETAERLATLSTEITVKRKAEIAAREEMEAHKQPPLSET